MKKFLKQYNKVLEQDETELSTELPAEEPAAAPVPEPEPEVKQLSPEGEVLLVRLIKKLPKNSSLFETILITINDYLVYKFLEKKINFQRLIKLIHKISNLKEFQKFKKIKPKNLKEIYNLRDYVHLKLETLGI